MPEIVLKLGKPQPKQKEFFMAHEKFVAFGGARGGGKSWAVREKAKRLALCHSGIKILIIRKTYQDLKDNHIYPLRSELPDAVAHWREADRSFEFCNGSRIKCSYFSSENDALQYQGQEFDVIFLEEATQFSERVYDVLKACMRGANSHPKRMYLTCNPDGIGFLWVKRLFVSRDYRDGEDGNDYRFIQSLVDDNQALLSSNPDYVKQLDSLPEEMRKRWRYGSWDVAEGQYFGEFDRRLHVCEPFKIDDEWRRYVAFDYGLDRLACYWIAVNSARECFVYKELCESNLTISDAAHKINEYTGDDDVYMTLMPPDMWGRSQETGRTKADIFYENGVSGTRSSNDREAGWLAIKELLKTDSNGQPRLRVFSNCKELIKCLPELQRDPKKPTDTLTEPHEITHAPDALRYFAVYWIYPPKDQEIGYVRYPADILEDYNNANEDEKKQIIKIMGGRPR